MPTKKPRNIVPALRRAAAVPPVGEDFTIKTATLTPEDAQEILDQMLFARQRNIVPGHVGMLADLMVSGQFRTGSQITFTPNEQGDLVLVDGQHQPPGRHRRNLDCQVDHTDNVELPRRIRLHRHGYVRVTVVVSRRRQGGGLRLPLEPGPKYHHLRCSLPEPLGSDCQIPILCNTPPVLDNVARATERLEAFQAADLIINDKHATTQIKRRPATPIIMAIMTETLRAFPEERPPSGPTSLTTAVAWPEN